MKSYEVMTPRWVTQPWRNPGLGSLHPKSETSHPPKGKTKHMERKQIPHHSAKKTEEHLYLSSVNGDCLWFKYPRQAKARTSLMVRARVRSGIPVWNEFPFDCEETNSNASEPTQAQCRHQKLAGTGITKIAIAKYGERNNTLRDMGFSDYKEYGNSDFWLAIRSKAFDLFGTDCHYCDQKATSIHHSGYGKKSLKGESMSNLFPVCRGCHYFGEFDRNGDKIHAEKATSRMRKRAKKRGFIRHVMAQERRREKVFKLARQKRISLEVDL